MGCLSIIVRCCPHVNVVQVIRYPVSMKPQAKDERDRATLSTIDLPVMVAASVFWGLRGHQQGFLGTDNGALPRHEDFLIGCQAFFRRPFSEAKLLTSV